MIYLSSDLHFGHNVGQKLNYHFNKNYIFITRKEL